VVETRVDSITCFPSSGIHNQYILPIKILVFQIYLCPVLDNNVKYGSRPLGTSEAAPYALPSNMAPTMLPFLNETPHHQKVCILIKLSVHIS
jgi:hypothetical protein